MNKILMTLSVLLLAGTVLTGCSNTFDGAGKDIEGVGDWFQDTF